MKHPIRAAVRPTLLAAVLALTGAHTQAQVAPQWAVSVQGVNAVASALDASQNVVAAGNPLTGGMLLTKVSPAGAVLWQQSFATPSRSTSVSVDGAGNVLLLGMLINAESRPVGSVVLKYAPDGTLLWQDVLPSSYGLAWRAQADALGNVYVLSRMATADGLSDELLLTRYSAAGTPEWVRRVGARLASLQPLAVRPDGRSVVAGMTEVQGTAVAAAFDASGNPLGAWSVATDAAPVVATSALGETFLVGSSAVAYTALKFDPAFNPTWNVAVAETGQVRRAAVDAAGNLLMTGARSATSGGFGATFGALSNDWSTMKLSGAGTVLWYHRHGSSSGDDLPNAMALAPNGAVQVAGQGSMALTDPATGISYLRPSTATVRLDPASGLTLWEGNELPSSQALDVHLGSDGATYVLGGGLVEVGQPPLTVLRYAPPVAPNQPPLAQASVSSSAGVAPLTVTFSAAGSSDPEGGPLTYQWDFGDGTASADANPAHTYAAAGSYSARLTVTDAQGLAAVSAPIAIQVNPAVVLPPQPASLGFANPSVVGGYSVLGKVTLTTAAGATVRLSSSHPKLAAVPSNVQVAAGSNSASFLVKTQRVRANTPVVITATANGKALSATLTVLAR